MNEASLYIEGEHLVIWYGGETPRTITMELQSDAERELVDGLLGDVNLWANFLSSLSAAMNRDNQEKIKSE